jgi:hypothetical protein
MQPFEEPHERKREGRGVAHEGERRALPMSSLNPLVSNSPLEVPLYTWRDGTHLNQLAMWD